MPPPDVAPSVSPDSIAISMFPGEVEQAELDRVRESHLQPVCEGASSFCCWTALCCLVGVVPPIVLFVLYNGEVALLVPACVLLAFGLFLFCGSIYPVLKCPPPKPAPLFPLIQEPTTRVPRRVTVLVNPMGGTKHAQGIFDRVVQPEFEKAGIEITKIETQYAGHAKVLCNTLPLDNVDAIVAIGGDGTFHECVNGLLERPDGQKCALGLVPGGSGNSVMTDFGLQNNVRQAVRNIAEGRIASIDAILVEFGPDSATNPRHRIWSINVVGYCADHCMASVNIDGWRPILGTARYDVCALWGLLKGRLSKGTSISVEDESQPWSTGVSALFANSTQHFGKSMRAAPDAVLDDGLMDIGNVKGSRGEVLRMFALIQTGAQKPLMESTNVKRMELRTDKDEVVFNVDGEVICSLHNKIVLTVHPRKFEFFVPSKKDWENKYGE